MKIINAIYNFIKVAVPACCLVSCNYLNVVPPETEDLPDIVKDEPSCLRFALSNYEGCWYHYYFSRFDNTTDEYVYPQIYNRTDQKLAWNQVDPTNMSFDDWSRMYQDLGQIHLFQRLLSQYRPSDVKDDEYNRWMAEMKFLQAYYHFLLLEDYGPIPISNQWFSENTDASALPGRSHFDCCVDSIVDWCDQASKVLPATVDVNETGRATSVACKALKARVLLYAASPLWNGSFPYSNWQNKDYETPGYGKELVSHTYKPEKWTRALEACKDALSAALAEGQRKLFDVTTSEQIRTQEKVDLPTIAGASDEFKQHVIQMRYLATTNESEGNSELIFGAYYPTMDQYDMKLPHAITKLTSTGALIGRWSGYSPTLYTVEQFNTKNGYLPAQDPNFTSESDWFKSAGISGRADVINLCANREPRFYAWIGYDGGEYSGKLANGKPLVVDMKNGTTMQGYNPTLYPRDNSATGFLGKKCIWPNLILQSSNNGFANMKFVHAPLFRLAECYLNLAECYAATGDTQNALANLNVIRERIGLPDLSSSDVTSSMTIMDWVRHERFCELFDEHHRYYDVRRWMIAPAQLKAGARKGLSVFAKVNPSFDEFNVPTVIDQPFQWTDRMYILPIKTSEVYSNPQLVQAPGY